MNDAELDSLDVPSDAPEPVAPDPTPEPSASDAKPEVKPEAKADAPKAEPKQEPKTIPLAAYLEDKNKWSSKFEAMERELNALKNPPKAPAPEPAFLEDPKGYVDHKVQAALEKLNGVEAKVTETGKTAEQVADESRFNRFMGELQTTEIAFTAKTPDYLEALTHLRTARAAEIQLAYPHATQEQIIDGIRREELTLAHTLMQNGRNPHEVAYQLAKARGYAPKAAPPVVPPLPVVPGVKQLPPEQTLGSGTGDSGESAENVGNEFEEAFSEMFGRRKRA